MIDLYLTQRLINILHMKRGIGIYAYELADKLGIEESQLYRYIRKARRELIDSQRHQTIAHTRVGFGYLGTITRWFIAVDHLRRPEQLPLLQE